MARYRSALPQLDGTLFLTDGGIETTLIYHEGLEMPHFAAFDLQRTREGEAALRKYFRTYAELAARHDAGLILESATWRASADWGARLGYSKEALAAANRRAIEMLEMIRDEFERDRRRIAISGCLGPRGDGYIPDQTMTAQDAERYHAEQIGTLAGTSADLITALTLNCAEEALGIVRAARGAGMPVVISFTVETDGALPTGQPLAAAIEQVDAATSAYPAYYMINCAHPTHFDRVVKDAATCAERIRGLRANASTKSHAELNEATELDVGDPADLGDRYARLRAGGLPNLSVFGGCCGTDHRHVEEVARACAPLLREASRR